MKKDTQYTYIMLSDTGSVLTRLIKRYTKIPYNHVSVALDEDLSEIYSFGRKFPSNPLIAGFVREYKDSGTFARFKNTKCLVLKLEITREQQKQLIRNIEYFKKRKRRYYYNIFCLLAMPFNIPLNVPYGYVCTHFVAHVHEQSGVKLFDKRSSLVSTVDFYNLDNVDVIYEGKLSEFEHIKQLESELVC